MPPTAHLADGNPATAPAPEKMSPWRLAFRIVRWTTYAASAITLLLLLHKTPPPLVETSPQAAARADEKFAQVEHSVAAGQPATLRLDETELNSFLATHLDLAPNGAASATPASAPSAAAASAQISSEAPPEQDLEQIRSAVRDVKIQLLEDRVKAYVVFDVHGKDMTLQLEGRLTAANGYLRFAPLSGQIGSLPIPLSSLESAVQRMMDSPENREKLRLPAEIADLRIENGEVVATYR